MMRCVVQYCKCFVLYLAFLYCRCRCRTAFWLILEAPGSSARRGALTVINMTDISHSQTEEPY